MSDSMTDSGEYEEVYEAVYEEEYEYEEEYMEVTDSDGGEDEDSSSDWSDSSSDSESEEEINLDALHGKSKYEIALIKWGKKEEDETKPKKEKKEKKDKKKKKVTEIEEDKAGVKKVAFDPLKKGGYSPKELFELISSFTLPKGRKAFGDAEVVSSIGPMMRYCEQNNFSAGSKMEMMSKAISLRWNLRKTKGQLDPLDEEAMIDTIALMETFIELYRASKDIPTEELYAELAEAFEHEDKEEARWQLFTTLVFGCSAMDEDTIKGFKLAGDLHGSVYQAIYQYRAQVQGLAWKVISITLRESEQFQAAAGDLAVRFAYHVHHLDDEAFLAYMDTVRVSAPMLPKADHTYEMVQSLAGFVHKLGQKGSANKQKIWIKLMLVFSYAASDQYEKAYQLYKGAELYQLAVATRDTDLLIFTNRALVSLGLAAFRMGDHVAAHNYLQELCAFAKQRELLAQATPRKQPGEEDSVVDRKRILPAHMFISSVEIELVHNFCAMFILAPLLVRQKPGQIHNLKHVNKHFVHLYDMHTRQAVSSSPESSRDVIMICVPKLCDGLWTEVVEILSQLSDYEIDLARYKKKIAEVALKCFVSKYAGFYQSMLIEDLAERFELTPQEVTSIVAQLLAARTLHGSLQNGVILLDKEERDVLSEHKYLVDRISAAMDSTEGLFFFKSNN